MKNNKYIYVYLDTRKPGKFEYGDLSFDFEPFYVGKGQGRRKFQHLNEAYNNKDINAHKCRVIRKIKTDTKEDPIVAEIVSGLYESVALKLEIEYISLIGRLSLKEGPLTNQTNGGQTSPAAGRTFEETYGTEKAKKIKRKISESKTGVKQSKEHAQKGALGRTGTKRSQETKDKMSLVSKGRRKTQAHKDALSYSAANRRLSYIVTDPSGIVIKTDNLRKFCEDNDLLYKEMQKISLRTEENKHIHRAKRHRGWECKKS